MTNKWSLGPVFYYECVAATRRWQHYGLRVVLVLLLLGGLSLFSGSWGRAVLGPSDVAEMVRQFFVVVVTTQLAVILLVAPAATAGAICVDKTRGTMIHVMATDLSSREIVYGKLGARLAPVCLLIACGVPVLSLSSLLGGIDLLAALGAYLVMLGVALIGCSLALTFSVWARKPQHALLPTYAVLILWITYYPFLADPLGSLLGWGWTGSSWAVELSNPIVLALLPQLDPTEPSLLWQGVFLGVAMLISLLLTGIAVRFLRPVVLNQASRPAKLSPPDAPARVVNVLPSPSLDANPILWREWHRKRPSRWSGRLWTVYAVLCIISAAWVVRGVYLQERRSLDTAAVVSGWQVASGLLLLSVSAGTVLAEERDRANLDIILSTPLSTGSILWGKWWGTLALVPRLSILPIWIAAAFALVTGRWLGPILLVGLIGAYASAIVSLGLAIGTWVRQPGRALSLSVVAYVFMTLGWTILVYFVTPARSFFPFIWSRDLLMANPYFGVNVMTTFSGWFPFHGYRSYRNGRWPGSDGEIIADALFWMGCYAAVSAGLLLATWLSFDRCLGRAPDRPRNPLLPPPDSETPAAPESH